MEDPLADFMDARKSEWEPMDAKPKSDSFAFLEIKKKILEVGYEVSF